LDLASGTRLTAELQGTLDAERARVGDKVVLKTTEVVRAGGGTVLKKGTRLLGHVADVQKRTRGAAGSSLTLVFDRLESGSLSAPVVLTIDSITRAGARGRAGDDSEFGAGASARGRTSTDVRAGGTQGGSSSGGGLLGGVTGAVGNTVGGVAGAAGDVAGTTTETVGGVARGAGSALGEVRVTEAVGLSAEGGSTLSLAAGNLRLEKGTTFRLSVSESAGVGNN
ncbi:MAG TPA: hypothetical protein VEY09_10535, partial [Pyrinomonadaceae bacterium]|nr:hypothetical protein [Pyrinomonadaceae bacterium]